MSTRPLKTGWKMVKFGEVVKNVNLVERDPKLNGIERIVGLEHLDPENLHIRRWNSVEQSTSFTRKFLLGQTLFGKRRAYQRKVAYAEFDGICSGDILTFESRNKNVLLPELLPFICQSEAFFDYALGTSAGSLSPRTSWTALRDFEFPLPPIDEQKRIAEILWAADEAVEKWMRVYSVLNVMLSVYRVEFFSRRNWQKKKLKDLFSVQLGKMLSPKAKMGKSSFPYLANYNVQWDHIDLAKVQEMSFSEREREKFALAAGDILVCEGGEVGRCAIWNEDIQNCYYQKALHRLRPISNFSSEVMLQFMMLADRKGLFKAHTGHSTIAHLTAIKLKEMDVPVPSEAEQNFVALFFREMKSAKHMILEQIVKTTELKQSLSYGLLTNGVPHV
ncbi:MAG: restriction endonuclease subunit S [Desulfobulbaceae bacterium]|jgi:type I restriction enzyme S subunit|nr:restriction endonuclease subunit S [Desulfobulbaceae bacterium]